jgi:signal transduction histidine kinase/ActR/RegA family two-component response regulator
MRVWGKLSSDRTEVQGLPCAILAGASRPELLHAAVQTLLAEGHADRVGVWLETNDAMPGDAYQSPSFRGIVADADGASLPAEWSQLSPAPLPGELFRGLKIVEQDRLGSSRQPVIGAMVGLSHAVWVPVETQGQLRGVILAGARKKHAPLPRTLAANVAAELALALEVEEERRVSRERQQVLGTARRALAALAGTDSPETILRNLVEDCTARGDSGLGPDAVFAAVGEWEKSEHATGATRPAVSSEKQEPASSPAFSEELRFHWRSGDAVWTRALEREPLSSVWRQALESQRVIGSEPSGAWSRREVSCVMAFPLRSGPETLGVLVAGIRGGSASPSTLERMELRATLAASALKEQKRNEQVSALEARQREAMDAAIAASQAGQPTALETGQQRARTELLNVIEWLEEGVVLFDDQNEIRVMNTRFGQIVGLTPQECVEIRTLDALVACLASKAADPRTFSERWHRWVRTMDGPGREELQLARPVPRLLERTAHAILDDRGALLGRVEIYRDLTAQRLFHSRLLQTEKMAALGQMVTGIAHELSNPLTSILGYAQRLLLRSDATSDVQEAQQIYDEAERAGAILRQLLLTARDSRPERGRVALNQVVSRTVELQRFNLAANKIRVELDLDPVLPFLQGDSGQLQQVLMNLMSNARQAMEEQGRGGTIRVRTRRVAENRVLLEVSDDGPGIPSAIQARIFDPFFTTKPAGVGTGLGLAIVLGIVQEHGGHVRVTSPAGGGTTFSVELPAAPAAEIPAPWVEKKRASDAHVERLPTPDTLATAQAGPTRSSYAGMRVLVVEDEPTVARLIGDVLEDEGLQVDVLLDGREALQRVNRESYDLVICDMKMPELDGELLYQTLVQADSPVRGRFVFVTGDVLAARTRDFLERHRLPHLAKPFRVEELTEKIKSVLAEAGPRGTAQAGKTNAARK